MIASHIHVLHAIYTPSLEIIATAEGVRSCITIILPRPPKAFMFMDERYAAGAGTRASDRSYNPSLDTIASSGAAPSHARLFPQDT
jgi:hypothetical protein